MDLAEEKKPNYSRIVIIFQEDKPEIVGFLNGDEEAAEEFYEKAGAQWSDSYLCQVLKGPLV